MVADVTSFLNQLGATSTETANLSVRTIIPKQPQQSATTSSSAMNESVNLPPVPALTIVTLPHITDRLQFLIKLKRGTRATSSLNSVFVDADLTPAESLIQLHLRRERNYLNNQRTPEET